SQFTNAGRITLDSIEDAWTVSLNIGSSNNGTLVNAESGVIYVLSGSSGARTINAEVANAGVVNFQANGRVGRPGAQHVNTDTGIFRVSGVTATVTGNSFTNQSGGEVNAWGTLDVSAVTFRNDGLLTLGGGAATGALTIAGNHTQTASGLLNIQVSGRN